MIPEEEIESPVTEEEDKPQWTSVHGKDLLVGVAILWAVEMLLGAIMVSCIGTSAKLEDHPVAVGLMSLISASITLLVCWFFVCKKYGKTFTSGFLVLRPDRRNLAISLAIGVGYGLIVVVLMSQFSTGQSMFAKMAESSTGLLCVITLALLLPVIEEVYYRGFLFPVLQNKWGSRVAVIVVTIWFGGIHVFQNTEDLIAIPVIAVLSAILTIQRCITRSLTPSIITHWVYNGVLVLSAVVAVLMKS